MSIAKFTPLLVSVFEATPSRAGRLTSSGQGHKIEILRGNASSMDLSIAKFTSSFMSVFEATPSRAGRLTSSGQSHKVEILRKNTSLTQSNDEKILAIKAR